MNADDKSLLANLYNNIYESIRAYKSLQWQVVVLVIGLFAGVIGLTQSAALAIATKPHIQWSFSAFCVAAAGSATWFIHHTARRLTRQRTLRRQIEKLFGFFDAGVFGPDAILDPAWRDQPVSYWQDRYYLISWWSAIWACCAYTIVVVWA